MITQAALIRTGLTFWTLACLIVSPMVSSEAKWLEGQHYQTLNQPVSVGRRQDVVVTEFFWYGCGHCFTFEPMLSAWGEQLPDGVFLQPSPAVWNEPMRIHAKAFFVAEVLGVKDILHQAIFNAMHIQRKRLVSRLEIRDLFEKNGVDPKKFDVAFDSFGVDSMVRQADQRFRSAKISGTPSIMVAGKYLVETEGAGSQANMLAIARFLVDRELALR